MPSPSGKQVSRTRTLLVPEAPGADGMAASSARGHPAGVCGTALGRGGGGAWGWDDQKLSISFSVERDIEETQMDWQG